MDGNRLVSKFVAEIAWADLPPEVQHKARLTLLDTLGAALAGTATPVARIAAEAALALWPGDASTVLRRDARASVMGAAFANANAANALDIDDCGIFTKGHPGAQLIPTALALAESLGASGARLLTALVVGYEVAHRAGRIWHATHDTYQACGSWGSVACAALSAHLLGLTPDQTWHALGIAEYHAPHLPLLRDIAHPAMVKHGVGWGAVTGLAAAELARQGFTGIPALFGFEEHRDWVNDIGHHYLMVGGVIWKKHACCAWAHAALRGIELLRQAHSFRAEEVERVRVEAYDDAIRLGGKLPTTTEEAQFNLAWPIAVLLIDGQVGPDQILDHRLADPRVRDLAARIELVETAELNRLYSLALQDAPGGRFGSVVRIALRDGRVLDSGIVEGEIKYPQQYWDDHSLTDKFRSLARRVLDESTVEALVDLVWRFEEAPDVRVLTRLMA